MTWNPVTRARPEFVIRVFQPPRGRSERQANEAGRRKPALLIRAVGFSGALWETCSVVSPFFLQIEILAQRQFDDGTRRASLSQRFELHGEQYIV